eukprot:scaffold51806_cov62-Attheya_sp.AAC.1
MESMTVDRDTVLATFDFLHANNMQYSDLPLITDGNYVFPDPVVVDTSIEEANNTDPQEQIFESTVYFPDGNEVAPETGGLGNSQAFTVEYLRRTMLGSTASTMTSRPTTEFANDQSYSFLVDSFPLQFPYGVGGPKEERDTPVPYLDCLAYYLRVANKHFMRCDFILIIHSLWEKEKAMRTASMRCGSKQDDISLASCIAELDPTKLAEAAQRRLDNRRSAGNSDNNPNTAEKLFSGTLEVSCKAMAHTNHASKSARIFFTISPCDETNFRMRLYIGRAEYMLPDTTFSDEDCIFDYKLHCEQRTNFPGASAFDFAAILDIVIADILGWDEDIGLAHPDGGAFGKINAFSGAKPYRKAILDLPTTHSLNAN